MSHLRICCPPLTDAVCIASDFLDCLGFEITQTPDENTAHLLLPVPSFPACGEIYGTVLSHLPHNAIISGGNLDEKFSNHRVVDFLKDPFYLADNAAITANCAFKIVKNQLGTLPKHCNVLIIGWGRIGKCLGQLFRRAGMDVTIAARKEADRAMIHALGCRSICTEAAAQEIRHYQVIMNTVPAMVFPELDAKPDSVILELASKPGMSGANIINARGLPGKMAPAESGELIARTFIRLSLGKEG